MDHLFILSFRHRIRFKSKVEKLCSPLPLPVPPLHGAPCQPKAQDCPPSSSPSLEPPRDLLPEHDATKQHVHFHNMSYFLKETERFSAAFQKTQKSDISQLESPNFNPDMLRGEELNSWSSTREKSTMECHTVKSSQFWNWESICPTSNFI